jgi:hypothetical protein
MEAIEKTSLTIVTTVGTNAITTVGTVITAVETRITTTVGAANIVVDRMSYIRSEWSTTKVRAALCRLPKEVETMMISNESGQLPYTWSKYMLIKGKTQTLMPDK